MIPNIFLFLFLPSLVANATTTCGQLFNLLNSEPTIGRKGKTLLFGEERDFYHVSNVDEFWKSMRNLDGKNTHGDDSVFIAFGGSTIEVFAGDYVTRGGFKYIKTDVREMGKSNSYGAEAILKPGIVIRLQNKELKGKLEAALENGKVYRSMTCAKGVCKLLEKPGGLILKERSEITFPDQLLEELIKRELLVSEKSKTQKSIVSGTIFMVGRGDPESQFSSLRAFWAKEAKSTAQNSPLPGFLVPVYMWANGLYREVPLFTFKNWPENQKRTYLRLKKEIAKIGNDHPGFSRLEQVNFYFDRYSEKLKLQSVPRKYLVECLDSNI